MLPIQEHARAGFRVNAGRTEPQLLEAGQRSGVRDSNRFLAHGHRNVFDRELQQVRADVVRMGELVGTAIDGAVDAFARQDLQAAARVVANDGKIDIAQSDLVSLIATTIATQAPVAGDLRFLVSLSHVTYELERIGDHAAGVARQVARLVDCRIDIGSGSAAALDRMGELTSGILHGVLLALVDLDAEAARTVAAQDDEIDRLYHAYFERTLARMRSEPGWVEAGAHLLFAAKDFERIGDRVTNIAEEVVFLSTGAIEDLNP
jgi:phosphate transport system protein